MLDLTLSLLTDPVSPYSATHCLSGSPTRHIIKHIKKFSFLHASGFANNYVLISRNHVYEEQPIASKSTIKSTACKVSKYGVF